MKTKAALLIYCDKYTGQGLNPLNYTANDAIEMEKKLKTFGYKTKIISNFDQEGIDNVLIAIDDFLEKPVEEFVFYYSGHGGECEGQSYLCHIDMDSFADNKQILRYSLKLSEIMESIGRLSGNKVIIFDACRSGNGKGVNGSSISIENYPENSIVCFATSPNHASFEDEENKHGYYTKALLDFMDTPDLQIEMLLKKVAQTVAARTNKKQIPWYHTSLLNEFCFNEESTSDFKYSDEAISDSRYASPDDSKVIEVIKGLKSHNCYQQNSAILSFTKLGDYGGVSSDDLFVLGRNICQSASDGGGAYSFDCLSFIKNFNSFKAPSETKTHLLNGMAFEMYFDKKGKLRKKFKASCKDSIISLLEEPSFNESRKFIRSRLNKRKRLIYLPGSGLMTIDVELSGDNNVISSLQHKGKILDPYNNASDTGETTVLELKKRIAEVVCVPINMLRLSFNKEIDADTIVSTEPISKLVIDQ